MSGNQNIESNNGVVTKNVEGDQYNTIVHGESLKNKFISSILLDYYYFRKKMIKFSLKLMIAWFSFVFIVSIIGMKYYNFDRFFDLFGSSLLSTILLAIYLWIANKYYKKQQKYSEADQAVVLIFFDLITLGVFYYINFVF